MTTVRMVQLKCDLCGDLDTPAYMFAYIARWRAGKDGWVVQRKRDICPKHVIRTDTGGWYVEAPSRGGFEVQETPK